VGNDPVPAWAPELPPVLFRVGSFLPRGFASARWPMAIRHVNRANGRLPNACASRAIVCHEERDTEEKTLITRHRSSSCGNSHVADGGISSRLRDLTVGKTRVAGDQSDQCYIGQVRNGSWSKAHEFLSRVERNTRISRPICLSRLFKYRFSICKSCSS